MPNGPDPAARHPILDQGRDSPIETITAHAALIAGPISTRWKP